MTTEAMPETLSVPERVATLEESHRHLATKEDLAELRSEMKEDNARLRTELKGDIAELRVLIERGQVNSTRWTVATIIAVGALIVAAIKFL